MAWRAVQGYRGPSRDQAYAARIECLMAVPTVEEGSHLAIDPTIVHGLVVAVKHVYSACYLKLAVAVEGGVEGEHYVLVRCPPSDHPVSISDYISVQCVGVKGQFLVGQAGSLRLLESPGRPLPAVHPLFPHILQPSAASLEHLHYSGRVVGINDELYSYTLDNSLCLYSLSPLPREEALTFYNIACAKVGMAEEALVYCPHFSSHTGGSLCRDLGDSCNAGSVLDRLSLVSHRDQLGKNLQNIISRSHFLDDAKFAKFIARVLEARGDSCQRVSFENDFANHAQNGWCFTCTKTTLPPSLLNLADLQNITETSNLEGYLVAKFQVCSFSGRMMVVDATGTSFLLLTEQCSPPPPNTLVSLEGLRLVVESLPDGLPDPRYVVAERIAVISVLEERGSRDERGESIQSSSPFSLLILKYLHPPMLLSSSGPVVVTVEGYTFGRLFLDGTLPPSKGKIEMIKQTAVELQLPAADSIARGLAIGTIMVIRKLDPLQFWRLECRKDELITSSKEIKLLSPCASALLWIACSSEAFGYLTQSQELLRASSVLTPPPAHSLAFCKVIPTIELCIVSREFCNHTELGLSKAHFRPTQAFREHHIGLPTRKYLALFCKAELNFILVIPPNAQMPYPFGLLPGARVQVTSLRALPGKSNLPPLFSLTSHSIFKIIALDITLRLTKYPFTHLYELFRQKTTTFISIIGQFLHPDMRGDELGTLTQFRCRQCGLPIKGERCPSHGSLACTDLLPLGSLTFYFADITAVAQLIVEPKLVPRLVASNVLHYKEGALASSIGSDVRLYCRFEIDEGVHIKRGKTPLRLRLEDFEHIDYVEQCIGLLDLLES